MISQFFVLSQRGDNIVFRDCEFPFSKFDFGSDRSFFFFFSYLFLSFRANALMFPLVETGNTVSIYFPVYFPLFYQKPNGRK